VKEKQKMNKRWLLGLWLTAAGFWGCDNGKVVGDPLAGGTGVGNPPQADVTISVKANSTDTLVGQARISLSKKSSAVLLNADGSLTVKDFSGSFITLTGIQVKLQKLDFELPQGLNCTQFVGLSCADEEASILGPYTLDLIQGIATPSINFIKLPEGRYSKITLEFRAVETNPQIRLDSMAIQENMTILGKLGRSDEVGKAFEIRLNLKDGLDFEDSSGIQIHSKAVNHLILKLDVDRWFEGIEFAKCLNDGSAVTDTLGTAILRGDTFCNDQGGQVRGNIEGSSEINNDEHFGQD
jgi:hypothetical protein